MKTVKEWFIQFGKKNFESNKENIEKAVEDADIKFIFEAMDAYGKQEYNQAIDDLIVNDLVTDRETTRLRFKKV